MKFENKQIAKNTAILYMRMLLILGINLYISRVTLDILGIDDFGIYNVVGGFILMFGFLNNAMATASARFIAFEQGRGEINRQSEVFSTSILIHIAIAVAILLLLETIGLWFVNAKMSISPERMGAANWVFQSAIFSFVCNILMVPYSSSVIAHEKMSFYAVISLFDAFLKLAIVFVLPFILYDKLTSYSILLFAISLIDFILYRTYCKRKFNECRFHIQKDFRLFKEMLSFAGWSFVGNLGISSKDYGVNVVLNLFCGTAVNAARGVAYQVTNAINGFVSNFQTAVTPQITKRYAGGEIESMSNLVFSSAKYSFFLLSLIVIPVLARTNYILNLWLVSVPEYSSMFLQLALIMGLINSMYGPISTAMLATGKIKVYQIAVCAILFLDLPISYVLLKHGATPYSVMYVAIVSAFVALVARLILLCTKVDIHIKQFMVKVIVRCYIVFLFMMSVPYVINKYIPQSFLGLVIIVLTSFVWSILIIYFLGLNKTEKSFITEKIKQFTNRYAKL